MVQIAVYAGIAATLYNSVSAGLCRATYPTSAPMTASSTSVGSSSSGPATSSPTSSSPITSSPPTSTSSAGGGSGGNDGSVILADISNIITQLGSLGQAVTAFQSEGDNALGSLLAANSAVSSAVSKGIADAQSVGQAAPSAASAVITAVEGLITGAPGIKSVLNDFDGAYSQFSASGLAGEVSSDLAAQSTQAAQFGSALNADAPSNLKPTGSALAASVASLFAAALQTYAA